MFFQELNCAFLSDRTSYSSIQFGLRRRSKITVKVGQKIKCSSVDHCLIPMKSYFFPVTWGEYVNQCSFLWRWTGGCNHWDRTEGAGMSTTTGRRIFFVFLGRGDFRVYWLIEFVLIKTLPFQDPNCRFFFAVGICFFWRWSTPQFRKWAEWELGHIMILRWGLDSVTT